MGRFRPLGLKGQNWKKLLGLKGLIKYVDDQTSIKKLDMSNAARMTVNSRKLAVKKAIKSESLFWRIEKNGNNIGMVVNSDKTSILCILAALSYTAETYIRDGSGKRIECTESMKALGFYFDRRPNASLHITKLIEKIRRRIWTLRHLTL